MAPDYVIFYDNGERFTSLDGDPWEAPAAGVQVLLQYNAAGNWVFYTQDVLYCWEWRAPGEWVPCDSIGLIDYMFNHRGPKAVLFGRWTNNENYEAIRKNADAVWRGLADG